MIKSIYEFCIEQLVILLISIYVFQIIIQNTEYGFHFIKNYLARRLYSFNIAFKSIEPTQTHLEYHKNNENFHKLYLNLSLILTDFMNDH